MTVCMCVYSHIYIPIFRSCFTQQNKNVVDLSIYCGRDVVDIFSVQVY